MAEEWQAPGMSETHVPEILVGKTADGAAVQLLPALANRHGLISGATGTGKTVTLQALAEAFSSHGVPVFTADVKGDLSGIARAGGGNARVDARRLELGLGEAGYRGFPAVFWDLEGRSGHPVRTTVSEMGPLLLGRLLELSDAQGDVLHMAFQVADDQGLLLLDLKDLNALLGWMEENEGTLRDTLGGFSAQSVATLRRKLVVLGGNGGEKFFGEPALAVRDLMRQDLSGQGLVHVLDARLLIQNPVQYGTFMLWLLSELFEDLDEVGDPPVPRLVFFFDEAHLLFRDAPAALVRQIEQVVRLVRSKGVGIYFVTQNPTDLPDEVLGQLGNRVQHALRAFSAKDRKAIQAAADTFPLNPDLDIAREILELEVGEALVSCLDAKGRPLPTQRTRIAPPLSRLGPLDEAERAAQIQRSPYGTQFDHVIDRESAHEVLERRAQDRPEPNPEVDEALGNTGKSRPSARTPSSSREERPPAPARAPAGRRSDTMLEALGKSVVRSVGSSVGRQVARGILGGLLGGRRR
jgi:DNA helicase HerA-like ATPase